MQTLVKAKMFDGAEKTLSLNQQQLEYLIQELDGALPFVAELPTTEGELVLSMNVEHAEEVR